ncbi:MAG: tetratricopeptide repeat protein [Porphyromonadaceae bacterium]|nr:tetratricopeptide repeat protein [Porphyromonadaceae bacterium]
MDDEKVSELVKRYEEMLRNGEHLYFDTEDIEDIAGEYEYSERYQEALNVVEYGLELHPENPELLVYRAGYLLSLNRIDEAERQISAVESRTADALLIRAAIALARSDTSRAVTYIDALFDTDDFSTDVCLDAVDLLLDYECADNAVAFLQKACHCFSGDDKELLLRELARVYEDLQKNEEAIDIYNRLLDTNPYSYTDWCDLARLLDMQGRYAEAIEAYDFALAIDENNVEIMISKGCCLYDNGNAPAAMRLFEGVLAVAGDQSQTQAMLAACYSHMELYEKAVASLRQAIRFAECPDADLYYRLAENYYNLHDIPRTVESLRQAVEIDAYHVDAQLFLGELEKDSGEWEEAEKRFLFILEIDPENAFAHKMLAQVLEHKSISCVNGERYCQEAIAHYARAVELTRHTNVEMLLALAVAQFKYGDVQEAIALADAIESLVKDPEVLKRMNDENLQELEAFTHLKGFLRDELGKFLDADL